MGDLVEGTTVQRSSRVLNRILPSSHSSFLHFSSFEGGGGGAAFYFGENKALVRCKQVLGPMMFLRSTCPWNKKTNVSGGLFAFPRCKLPGRQKTPVKN